MDYFSKFLRSGPQPSAKVEIDHAQEFHKSWTSIKSTLEHPDERQLARGIKATDVPAHLKSMVDALVWESTRMEEGGTGACLEYLLKNDVLGTLVKLSESDRPVGIQAEVLRAVQNMVVLLDEQFLVHSAVHKAVLRLLRNCVGDDIQEQLDGRNRVVGAARNSTRSQPSEYEADLVNLLCILCSRIRHYRELLMIFFHDKHWYRPEPLFAVEEEDEDEEDEAVHTATEEGEGGVTPVPAAETPHQSDTPLPDDTTAASSTNKKPEYEFLLFNYLLRFVHREGQIGDFARAGLLFLMDVAMTSIEPSQSSSDLSSSTSTLASGNDPTNDAALALAEYILDGDFSDVLAAGLAAVYSILPTKLEIRPPVQTESTPSSGMILGGSAVEVSEEVKEREEIERENRRYQGVEDSSNLDFKSRLDHFLKLLEFLQDVLRRNIAQESPDGSIDPSSLLGGAIVQSILDAVRRVFLENVLYPSILECSDSDGSAVAVMSYVEIMIRTLDNGQLGDLLVDFLTSEDNTEDLTRSRMRPRHRSTLDLSTNAPPQTESTRAAKSRRRKSAAMALLEIEAPHTRQQSGYFTSMGRFTLRDLLLSSLRSASHATVTSAMQLLHTMLQQYCRLSVEKLLVVIHDPFATSFPQPASLLPPIDPTKLDDDDDEVFVYPGADTDTFITDSKPSGPSALFVQPETTFLAHEREMTMYLSLVSRVNPNHTEDAFSTGYDHYLRDALATIESQQCFYFDVDLKEREKLKHRLNPSDPMLSSLVDGLRRFFANTPELNMSLTGVLATLAICPDRALAGWLTFAEGDKKDGSAPDMWSALVGHRDDGDDRSVDWRVNDDLAVRSAPLATSTVDERTRPVVYTILHGLVQQLERYRTLVADFDRLLLERRQGLLFSENLTDALTLALDVEGNAFARAVAAPPPDAPRPKPKSKGASFVSIFSPKKRAKPQPAEAGPRGARRGLEASPFGPHYQRTAAVVVEPYLAPAPSDGPWQPAKPVKKWDADEEDAFASGQWGDMSLANELGRAEEERIDAEEEQERKVTHVTLSQLLDNVVILEECMKELVAIIHARRSLGIDLIRYL
ncbi:Retinoic acid induced 16-like protein-domain-containing protein [Phanerochaete sordida]|uniref:Retinoic acid induced 16-like protein-domain-containing protein n=1 Tax=Phanerochaete sordida TaxID=48140 RepID=A0A9P3GHJ7_9APHY|nr:Retinoic acid induced 16-like protein-domain-containing protein [Phanerochaete sordida]